jgi:hypothetical protein
MPPRRSCFVIEAKRRLYGHARFNATTAFLLLYEASASKPP